MKKHIPFTLVTVILLCSILACNITIDGGSGYESVRGSGTLVEEDRNVSNITGIQLANEGTLHITMGNSESLRIEAEDNLLEYINTDVRGSKLIIETRQGINLDPKRPIDYYLTVEKLSSILISSSGNVDVSDLQTESFSVTISSSGDLIISRLDCESLRVDISSSGSLEILDGQVHDQNIIISSSGEYRAKDVVSVEADVTLTSSGTVTIRVSDHLRGRLSSSGDIYYIGNPEVNVRTTSSGKAVQIDD
jgi:hypothetical protein